MFKSGDRVALSAAFLRQIGVQTGELPQLRGTVVELCTVGQRELVRVRWQGEQETQLIVSANLAQIGPNSKFCNC